jgi:hypothetical protein
MYIPGSSKSRGYFVGETLEKGIEFGIIKGNVGWYTHKERSGVCG